jgi:AraC family ethanolamine operon transcriptional activator
MDATTQTPLRDLPKELSEVSVVCVTDPTIASDLIEVLDQDVVNLDPKGFEVKRVTVPLGDCCLIYHRSKAALRTQTRIHEDFEACTVLGPHSRGSIDGMEMHSYALLAAGPGVQAEIIIDSNYESVALLVPPHVLDKHLAMRRMKEDFVFPERQEVWHPGTEVAKSLFELGTRIAEEAERTPEVFNNNHWARYGAQVEFMDALFATIESCDPDEHVDTDKKGKSYSQIVRTCEEHTLNLDGRRSYLSELCAAANVSERTLQYAFQDIMGMSPMSFLHRLRLHRARNELRRAKSDSTTVTNVAMNWGFWHFGEFSRAYKNCFGELPSKTLKMSSSE